MLLEISFLQNHAPSNLNRDDSGSPKDCIFGGSRRSRISSQSLKRSIRCSDVFESEVEKNSRGIRTRRLPELVKEYLIENGIDEKLADAASEWASLFGKNVTKGSKKDNSEISDSEETVNSTSAITAQTFFLSPSDIEVIGEYLKNQIKENPDPKKIKAIKRDAPELKKWRPITPDIALFGRMVTDSAFNNVQASMQVAHAISTNKMDLEFDYFTAVDDLQKMDEGTGADMVGNVEFNSACYYKYFALDFDAFVDNLAGDLPKKSASAAEKTDYDRRRKEAEETALKVVEAFINAALLSNPTGKQNSFAAHQFPDAVLIEIKEKKIPLSYANAFLKPCSPINQKDLMEVSIERLLQHIQTMDEKYELEITQRFWFTTKEINPPEKVDKICKNRNELVKGVIEFLNIEFLK